MTKRVEFHQANITTLFRVIDGDRSLGLRQMQSQVLVDTDAEWADVRRQIQQAMTELEAELNGGNDGD